MPRVRKPIEIRFRQKMQRASLLNKPLHEIVLTEYNVPSHRRLIDDHLFACLVWLHRCGSKHLETKIVKRPNRAPNHHCMYADES